MTRLACLLVPLFPLAARLRAEPELAGEALAVTAGNGSAARVVAASRAARKLGIRAGMTLAQARALVPKLAARGRDAAGERAAQEALAEVAESFSPRVEDAGEGVVFIDLDGGERRLTGAAAEPELGQALARAAHKAGLPARVGIAASKLAAEIAARSAEGDAARVVPTGDEAAFLAPLPLARLTPELDLAATLARWGLASIGDFARLPAAEVASRLGAAGTRLHAVARGIDPRPLLPRRPPDDFREGLELEWPLVSLEPFLFVARAALDRLCQRLETRGLGCARLELELTLEPAGHDRRAWQLPAPTRDAKTLLTLARLELDARPPGAAVAAFLFAALPDRPRLEQGTLFGPRALAPERLATTLARLFALLGPERVGSPRPVDGHRPERFALLPYAPPPAALGFETPPPPARGLLAVRTLRPPLELEVQVAAGAPGESRPVELRAIVREENARRPHLQGAVRVASGPWRLEEGWWSESATARAYWDVELVQGGLVRIYRDAASDRWFADGVYD